VDAAWCEDLRGRLFSLLIAVEDRLGREHAQWVHHVIDVDEYGLALEDMVGMLAYANAPVTDQERADMLALAVRMQMNDLAPRVRHCATPDGQASIPGDDGAQELAGLVLQARSGVAGSQAAGIRRLYQTDRVR
jgi:hypothetical protein